VPVVAVLRGGAGPAVRAREPALRGRLPGVRRRDRPNRRRL